jgi:hypothetical protein
VVDVCLATLARLPRVCAFAKTVSAMDLIDILLIQVLYRLEQITDDDLAT